MPLAQFSDPVDSPWAFSVLMAVYAGEQPEYLSLALESLCASTVPACELVLVEDGPLTESLSDVVEQYRSRLPIRSVVLARNQGLGPALLAGLHACRAPWVARFDTDDLIEPDRFERQIAWLQAHPDVGLCGGWIREFDDDLRSSPLREKIRRVPQTHEEIVAYARWRNPMNHMTVMFRKEAALAAKGYANEPLYEDYALWVRMLQQGTRMANLPSVLVRARAGGDMFARRGGWKYVRSEYAMQATFLRSGFIGPAQFVANLALRLPVRLVPNMLRKLVYQRFLRR